MNPDSVTPPQPDPAAPQPTDSSPPLQSPQPVPMPVEVTTVPTPIEPQPAPITQQASPVAVPAPQPTAQQPTPLQAQTETPIERLEDFEHKEEASLIASLHKHQRMGAIICTVIVLLASAANVGGVFHILHVRKVKYAKLPSVQAEKAQKEFANEVVDRPDGTLDMSEKFDSYKTTKEQHLTAKLKQQVNFSNGVSMMVTDYEQHWKSLSTYPDKPQAGNEYLRLHILVGNRDTKANKFFLTSSNIWIVDSSGKLQKTKHYFPDTGGLAAGQKFIDQNFEDDTMKPGGTISGEVVIEVPKGTLPQIGFVYDEEYSRDPNAGPDEPSTKMVTLDAKVTLQ